MDLLNGTKMVAGYTLGVEPSGREHLVATRKGYAPGEAVLCHLGNDDGKRVALVIGALGRNG